MSGTASTITIDTDILGVKELIGSDDPPYAFPIPGISLSLITINPDDYMERFEGLRFESDEDDDVGPWTPRIRNDFEVPSSTPHMPGHLSMSNSLLRPELKGNKRGDRALVRYDSDIHPFSIPTERKELCRLFRTIFRPPLPEERVEDMADLIVTAASIGQVKETVEGLDSLYIPADLVVSRIGVILGFQELGKTRIPSHIGATKNEGGLASHSTHQTMQETTAKFETKLTLDHNSADASTLHRCNFISSPTTGSPIQAAISVQSPPSQCSTNFSSRKSSLQSVVARNLDADTPKPATSQVIALDDASQSTSSSKSLNHTTKLVASTSSGIINQTLDDPVITSVAVPRPDSPSDDEASSANVTYNSEDPEKHDIENSASDEESHDNLSPRWAERTITTTKTQMYWTTSESSQDLSHPTVPGAVIGHIHLHRNSHADHVQVWLLESESTWVDYSSRYGSTKEPFIKHPIYSALVLTTRGRKKAPSFVTVPYLQKKIKDLESVKK